MWLIEFVCEVGVVGKVFDCINSGKYIEKVDGLVVVVNVYVILMVWVNGIEYEWLMLVVLVVKIKEIVGDVLGIDLVVVIVIF